jgi:hypothetical protein
MTRKLVDLYSNFASSNSAIFSGFSIEASKPHSVKCLDISDKSEMNAVDEYFGNGPFWDVVDDILTHSGRTHFDEL